MKKKLTSVVLSVILAVTLFPSAAFAANIQNSIWSEPNPTWKNTTVNVKQRSVYKMLGIGSIGIPFMSNWKTELQGYTWNQPNNTWINGVLGNWHSTNYYTWTGDWVWRSEGSSQWFYGETTWWAHTSTSAKTSHWYNRIIKHGQSDWWEVSMDTPSTYSTACY